MATHIKEIQSFASDILALGETPPLPKFSGRRIQVMPFYWHDPQSVGSQLCDWWPIISDLTNKIQATGVGYITIDESYLKAGEYHRRPGMHVDGVAPDGSLNTQQEQTNTKKDKNKKDKKKPKAATKSNASWSTGFCAGGAGGFSAGGKIGAGGGIIFAASHYASHGWAQMFTGAPTSPDGDCEHLRSQVRPEACIKFLPGGAYWLSPLGVHEVIAVPKACYRQFLRLSTPNDGWWFEGYTPNPHGIKPTGHVKPRRSQQMAYRPS